MEEPKEKTLTEPAASSAPAATAAPSPAPAATPAEPSPAPPKEPSLADVARQAFEESTKTKGDEEEGQGQEMAPTEEQPSVEEPATPVTPVNPDEELPFHTHPRFQELIKQKNEYEAKVSETEAKLKEVEPRLKWVDNHAEFVKRYGITDQEFADAMTLLALKKSDPAKYREALKPVIEQAKEYDPDYVPQDLLARVQEGEISEAAAKELAQARAALRQREQQHVAQQQTWQQQQAQAQQQAIVSWDQNRRAADPDFKPKASANDPDGLWEMTAAKFAYLQTTKFAQTPQEIVAHLESAYKDSKGLLTRLAKALPPMRPAVTTSKSSTVTKKKESEMSTAEVVAAAAAKHGIHWTPES